MGKNRKINKGAPSGLVISLLFHVGAFFVAGLFIVFTVANQPEDPFEPPPLIERPEMKLKKPKVKVRKSSQPKPSSRIVAKMKTRELPEIQLPDLAGTGEGLLGGTGFGGDFLDLPEIPKAGLLGSEQSSGCDLVGTFYDFKRTRQGRWIGYWTGESAQFEEYVNRVYKFIKDGFDTSHFNPYYKSPKKLYASCIIIPTLPSEVAPCAFDGRDAAGDNWVVHYQGKLVHKEGITFRFVCAADVFLVIQVNGEIVYGSSWSPLENNDYQLLLGSLYNMRLSTRGPFLGNDRAMAGEWITLEPGVAKDIDIIFGDANGLSSFYVCVEEEGAEYENGPQGYPIYPAFRTQRLTHDELDQIYKHLPEGEVCLTNGPVFNDIGETKARIATKDSGHEKEEGIDKADDREIHTWTFKNGKTLEAEYVRSLFDKLVLKDESGKDLFIEKDLFDLSDDDQEFLLLENPPELKLQFKKSIQKQNFAGIRGAENRAPEQRAEFGASIRQTSTGDYPFSLTAEVYAIGEEIEGNRYLVLDRFSCSFDLCKENMKCHEFQSDRVVQMTDLFGGGWNFLYTRRGEHYYGSLIIVRDKRGRIIAHDASHDWLYEHLGELEQRHIGNYMDKTCKRTFPSRPKTYLPSVYPHP